MAASVTVWQRGIVSDRPLAVVDVDDDGVDVRHRLHHLRRRPRDWDAFFAAAAVLAYATPEGIIASSSGNAMVTPMPRRTVRRDKCFFVKNINTTPEVPVLRFRFAPPAQDRYRRCEPKP